MKLVLPILLVLVVSVNSLCLGVPLTLINGKSFNCRSLCCADGYVQDLITGTTCVTCDSVGLYGCASCGLYATSESGSNYTYKCLISKNIEGLVTVGSSSLCAGPGGVADNTYVLNNWTNFSTCSPCSDIIPHSVTCRLASLCATTIAADIGNGCEPRLKALQCENGYMLNNFSNACQSCSSLIYGCVSCSNKNCTACDAELNLTTASNKKSCVCIPDTECVLCGSYQIYNGTTEECQCITGYTNVSDVCVFESPCQDHNQALNPETEECQCKKGYSLNSEDLCEATTCGDNAHLTPSGSCACDNGYTLVDQNCILLGSYHAFSKMYFVKILDNLNVSVNVLSNYTCSCPAGFRMIADTCMPCSYLFMDCPCPEGWIMHNGSCVACSAFGQPGCTACDAVHSLQDQDELYYDWCLRCQPGFDVYQRWANGRFSMCWSCRSGCSSCADRQQIGVYNGTVSHCLSCLPGYYFYETQYCLECSKSISHCINCYTPPNDFKNVICRTCDAPYVLASDNKSCICPNGLIPSNQTCIPCHVGCMQCDENRDCLKCWPGTVLNSEGDCQCVSTSLSIDILCEDCKTNLKGQNIQGCIFCATSTTCAQCVTGYVLYDGNCEICSRFIPGCLSCSSSSVCTVCDEAHFYVLDGGECACNNRSTMINGICKNCSELILGCNECSGYNTCTVCNESSYFILTPNNTCACQTGFILERGTCFFCEQMIAGCALCDSKQVCRACKHGWVKTEDNKCQCNYAAGWVQVPGNCLPCAVAYHNCTSCDQTRCLDCDQFWNLNVTTSSCDIMVPCPIMGCAACTQQRCITCISPAYLDAIGACKCPNYYLMNYTAGQCQLCDQPTGTCKVCTNSGCLTCADSIMHKHNGTCHCPNGMYLNLELESCELCKSNCLGCSSLTTCTACSIVKNRVLVNGSCDCIEGHHSLYPNDSLQDGSMCVPIEEEEEEDGP